MPWETFKLNDGRSMPGVAFGSSQHTGQDVSTAIEVGFDHIDTAQSYRNEDQVGQAIKESGMSRREFWVTTKWSWPEKTPRESAEESLRRLGLDHVDLYLIHSSRVAGNDIPGAWKKVEEVHKLGYAKSIGISNYDIEQTKEILDSCQIRPAVNQIYFHPGLIKEMGPLVEFNAKHGIVTEGYSGLRPLRDGDFKGVKKVSEDIAAKRGVKAEQVLMAWGKAKGVVVITSSGTKSRMESYLDAGDIHLTPHDIRAIDHAGIEASEWIAKRLMLMKSVNWMMTATLMGYAAYQLFA